MGVVSEGLNGPDLLPSPTYSISSTECGSIDSLDKWRNQEHVTELAQFTQRIERMHSNQHLDEMLVKVESRKELELHHCLSNAPIDNVKQTSNLVVFGEQDPEDPQNWSASRKWATTAVLATMTLASTYTSSSPSAAISEIKSGLDVTAWQVTLTNSCFLLGFAMGPLVIAPISELNGRRKILLLSGMLCTIFNVACGLSTSLGMLGACRFLAGTFASSPLTLSGAILVDIFSSSQRGTAMAIFSLAPFLGPALGPIVAGFVAADCSWRYVYYICACFTGACTLALFFIYQESLGSVILIRKARYLRQISGNETLYAAAEKIPQSVSSIISVHLARPLTLLFSEPIVALISIYMAVIYGILYMFFVCYPLIFVGVHRFSTRTAPLAFIPFALGSAFGLALSPLWNRKWARDMNQFRESNPDTINPEARLPMTCLTGPMIIGSLLLLGWTGYRESIHWMVPMLAGFPFGIALIWTFTGFFSYLADTYLGYTASAMAANALLRSLFGFGFPLFAAKMYRALSIPWASTLLAGLALLLTPVPFVFWKMGHRIRKRSKYAK